MTDQIPARYDVPDGVDAAALADAFVGCRR
jgi:hypothetical protein